MKNSFVYRLKLLSCKRKKTANNQVKDAYKQIGESDVFNEAEKIEKKLLIEHSSSDECNPKYKEKVDIKTKVVRFVLIKMELCERKSLKWYLMMNIERDKVLLLNWYSQVGYCYEK